jgi:hypothetical protein
MIDGSAACGEKYGGRNDTPHSQRTTHQVQPCPTSQLKSSTKDKEAKKARESTQSELVQPPSTNLSHATKLADTRHHTATTSQLISLTLGTAVNSWHGTRGLRNFAYYLLSLPIRNNQITKLDKNGRRRTNSNDSGSKNSCSPKTARPR